MSGTQEGECRSHAVILLVARDFEFPVPVILNCTRLEILVTKGDTFLSRKNGSLSISYKLHFQDPLDFLWPAEVEIAMLSGIKDPNQQTVVELLSCNDIKQEYVWNPHDHW